MAYMHVKAAVAHTVRGISVWYYGATSVFVTYFLGKPGHQESKLVRLNYHAHDAEAQRQMKRINFIGGAGAE